MSQSLPTLVLGVEVEAQARKFLRSGAHSKHEGGQKEFAVRVMMMISPEAARCRPARQPGEQKWSNDRPDLRCVDVAIRHASSFQLTSLSVKGTSTEAGQRDHVSRRGNIYIT